MQDLKNLKTSSSKFAANMLPNIIWDGIKWIGGFAVVKQLWQLIRGEYHRSTTDWWIFSAWLFFGVALVVIGYWLQGRKMGDVRPAKDREHGPISSPSGVDFDGEILELYFYKWGDVISFPSRTTILLRVRVVNRGIAEATITRCGLSVKVGVDNFDCDFAPSLPNSWRIRRRDERVLNIAFIDEAIDGYLGADPDQEAYRRNIPRTGWLAFEYYSPLNIEFTNAELELHFQDSLGKGHVIRRAPMVYVKSACIVDIGKSGGSS